jgi:hypothetical protein
VPESLETPYQDTPPGPAPAPAPTGPASANGKIDLYVPPAPDTRPLLPIRARRRLALTGELGWNGLAGFGPVLSYYPDPHFGMDLGLGFSLMGWKMGLRGRYDLFESAWTPFIGGGFNVTSGLGEITADPSQDPNGDPNREPVTVNLQRSFLMQGVVGVDFMHRRGFTMLGALGYSYLVNRDNYDVLAGELTNDEKEGFRIAFKGGLLLSISLGYAFE